MRPRLCVLALLAAAVPACWTGFSEVRIAAGDASAPGDRPATDRPTTDAPRAPDGSQDAADTSVLDAPAGDVAATPDDRPAGDAGDAAAPLDASAEAAVDAGAMDAAPNLDAPATDAQDASARDVVDAPAPPLDAGPCGGACGAGEVCVGGRCQAPTRFVGVIFFADPTIYDAPPGATSSWEMQCAARFTGSRLCRRADLEGSPLLAQVCTAVLPPRFDRSYGLAGLGDAPSPFPGTNRPYYTCAECPTNGFPGMVAGCHIPYAIACCAP